MANRQVISAAGLAVAGGGVLLIWMGVKNYTFSTVADAAIKGKPLVSASETGVLGLGQGWIKPMDPVGGGGGGGLKPTLFTPEPQPGVLDSGDGISVALDGINWGGSIF